MESMVYIHTYSARITPLSIDQVSRMTMLCIIYMLHTCLLYSNLIKNFKTFQHCRDGIASRAILFLAADRLIHAHHRGNHMYANY